MVDDNRPLSVRGRSVQQDWRAWLPEEKARVFVCYERHLESHYIMFSVSLNESIELLQQGRLGKALENIGVSSGLCALLAHPLACLLRALFEHAKHYGTMPNAVPLDPANFVGPKSQRKARFSVLLSGVLLSQRQQFLHKAGTLTELVDDVAKDFCNSADRLAECCEADPLVAWDAVNADHYDLNTCLRETIVLFKSFLMALPGDQLDIFQATVREQSGAPVLESPLRQFLVRHRRLTQIAGQ